MPGPHAQSLLRVEPVAVVTDRPGRTRRCRRRAAPRRVRPGRACGRSPAPRARPGREAFARPGSGGRVVRSSSSYASPFSALACSRQTLSATPSPRLSSSTGCISNRRRRRRSAAAAASSSSAVQLACQLGLRGTRRERLQAHPQGHHGLDRVVVQVLDDPLPLVLVRIDELAHAASCAPRSPTPAHPPSRPACRSGAGAARDRTLTDERFAAASVESRAPRPPCSRSSPDRKASR